MEKGTQVDALYTYFSKAFDKVNHNILILNLCITTYIKLSEICIHGNYDDLYSIFFNKSQILIFINYITNVLKFVK